MEVRKKLVELMTQVAVLGDYLDMRKVADHLIANGVSVQGAADTNVGSKWISVKERLPEHGNLVLAIDRDGLMSTGYYVGRWHGMLDENAITHWMPLPKPPKK